MCEEYFIEDFTENNYRNILEYCYKKFDFIKYDDAKNRNGLIWRHDVDFSVHRAYRLAVIEKEFEISATYFIHLHSEYYNVMESDIAELINKILQQGQSIGIHFDPGFYGDKLKTETDLKKYLLFEKNILEEMFETKINSFSFHNPDIGDYLKYDDFEYAGLINAYASFFKEKFKYCSDSNGYWRFKRLRDFLEECQAKESAQVLTHPGWWTEEAMSPKDRMVRSAQGRATNLIKNYDQYFIGNKLRNNF